VNCNLVDLVIAALARSIKEVTDFGQAGAGDDSWLDTCLIIWFYVRTKKRR
jgi:hypothetical protein